MHLRIAALLPLLVCGARAQQSPASRPYTNPIIRGFSPDPSCTRVGARFFCVNSSFNAFPGIPVYTSRDLVEWEQIGNVLCRAGQLPELGREDGFTSGIWAATIREHCGTFYVTTTLVWDKLAQDDATRWDNIMFTTTDIFANEWSDAVHISPPFEGYDISLFWDDDGKTYMQGSHAYHVQPGIWQYEIDLANGTTSNQEVLWTGTGGLAPEGPHVYKKDGAYYLMIAEGGTGVGHMETMARSEESIHGPYVAYERNPVLTNANTSEYLQTVGHADLFDDTNGNWWSVALATRNGTIDFPMGRETVIVPVTWEEGEFPVFNGEVPGRARVHMDGPLPNAWAPLDTPGQLVGEAQLLDLAALDELPLQMVYLRLPDTSRYRLEGGRGLCLLGAAANLTGPDGVSGTSTFVGRRQEHVRFVAEAELKIDSGGMGEQEAGVTVFLQQLQHFDFGVVMAAQDGIINATGADAGLYVRLRTTTKSSTDDDMQDPLSQPGMTKVADASGMGDRNITLRIEAVNASTYLFSYANSSAGPFSVVASGAASEVSGGFTGTIIGMYATGEGKNVSEPACFSRFDYWPTTE